MNQFGSFISQYASNAAERVACHYKEHSLTFRIVFSLLKFAVGQGFFPYTNILCPATVGTTVGCFWRGPVLHVVKSSTESTLHCDHRIGPRELKDTEHFAEVLPF
jgi:hypothetical protein